MFRLYVFIVLLHYSSQTLTTISQKELNERYGNVVFVSAITRHGDRTPLKYFPNYDNTRLWKEGLGELTNLGKEQKYESGKYLRKRYIDLLSTNYHKNYLDATSSCFGRTLMTAYCILAGMYPPVGQDIWNKDLNWQPIPVHTTAKDLDEIIVTQKPCERIKFEKESINDDPELNKLVNTNRPTINHIADKLGVDISSMGIYDTFNFLMTVHDTFQIEERYGISLPEWTKKVYPKPLENFAVQENILSSFTDDILRIFVGKLLNKMVKQMTSVESQKTKKRFHLYSAHDVTVRNLLKVFGCFDHKLISYGAVLLFELRRKKNTYFVTVLYKNSKEEPYLLNIGCEKNQCTFENFKQIASPYFVSDLDKFCDVSFLETVNRRYSYLLHKPWFIGVISLVIGIIVSLIIFAQRYHFKHQMKKFKTILIKNNVAKS